MTGRPSIRGRAFERGEGNLRLIIFLIFIAVIGYIGVKNVPTYFAMQNVKHDIAEMTRGEGVLNQPIEKIQRQSAAIAQEYSAYGITTNDIDIRKDGKLTT